MSIQARTSRDKNAKILTHFQIRKQSKFVSIITFRNRGFVRPALDRLLSGGCSVSMPIFSSIGDDVCAKLEIWQFSLFFRFPYIYRDSREGVKAWRGVPVLGLPKQCFFRRFCVFSLFLVVACPILKKMSRSSASELSIQRRTSSGKFAFLSFLKMQLI